MYLVTICVDCCEVLNVVKDDNYEKKCDSDDGTPYTLCEYCRNEYNKAWHEIKERSRKNTEENKNIT